MVLILSSVFIVDFEQMLSKNHLLPVDKSIFQAIIVAQKIFNEIPEEHLCYCSGVFTVNFEFFIIH